MFEWRTVFICNGLIPTSHHICFKQEDAVYSKTELNISETCKRIIAMSCNQKQKEASAYC